MKQHKLSKIASSEISRNEAGNNYGSTSTDICFVGGRGSVPSQSRESHNAADGKRTKRVSTLSAYFASEAIPPTFGDSKEGRVGHGNEQVGEKPRFRDAGDTGGGEAAAQRLCGRRTRRPFTVDEESKATPPTFRLHMGRAGQENEKVVRNVAFAMHAILRGARRQKRGRAVRELGWEVRSSKARGMKWTCTSRMDS
jgi:hypothetical protein